MRSNVRNIMNGFRGATIWMTSVRPSTPPFRRRRTGSSPVPLTVIIFAILAQLVELLISNQNVVGSIPTYRSKHKSQGSRFLVSFAPLVDALSIIAPWLEPASWTTVLSPALRWPALTREIGRRPVKSSDKTLVVTPVILRGETRKYRRGNEFNLSVGKWYVVPFGTEFSGVRFTPLRPNYVSGYLVANKSVKSSNAVTSSPGTIPVMRLSRTAQTEELSHIRKALTPILQTLLFMWRSRHPHVKNWNLDVPSCSVREECLKNYWPV